MNSNKTANAVILNANWTNHTSNLELKWVANHNSCGTK